MALSLGQPGLSAALFALMLRFFSLLLCALGLHLMSTPGRDESRRSWAVILFAYGAFSLAGVPLTPGFAGRWAILDMAGAVSTWLAAALLLFAVAGVAGLLRWLITWFDANPQAGFLGRSRLVTILVALILLGAILVALRPGPLLNAATSLAALF
jgi:formate hydrogenlyase subunit 3/multisubunit Na+/H+ antiporter MnhD subunit